MTDDAPGTKSDGSPYRLLIADDHELARAGLRAMLSGEPGLEIVAEATTGREAVDFCRELRPDLALLDVRMPELDGLSATREIKQASPATSVIIFTLHESADYLLEAVRAGAAGYLLKDAGRIELVTAIRHVLAGEPILSGDVATRLFRRLTAGAGPVARRSQIAPLTPRELDVLRLVVRGKTNREIGEALGLSSGTAKVHVEHIIAKLGVSDRTQAAVRAIEMGLLSTSG